MRNSFSHFIEISFADRPTILSSIPSNITMNSSESREINCTAIGNPQPKTYWLNSQMGIESNSILLLNASATKTSIETFTCVAENSVGKDMKTVSVTFLGEFVLCSDFHSLN